MAVRITDLEFPHVLALLRAMLREAGLGAWEIEPWLSKSAARIARDYRENSGAYFVTYIDGQPVGVAGAQLREAQAFLSFKTTRYGQIVDEYVLANHRGNGLEQKLRTAALGWIAQMGMPVLESTPPNLARLAVHSHGGKL
ncbi:MAG: GNAT family N-acetyltransferase [Nibricoccus sp.]